MDTRPALPLLVDYDNTRIRVDKFGIKHREYEMAYTEYDIGRIREGYCCLECGEAQIRAGMPVAFPENCQACGFPMRAWQVQKFGEQFDGDSDIKAPRPIEELRAEDEEQKEIARRIREGKPTSSILVPGWARAS